MKTLKTSVLIVVSMTLIFLSHASVAQERNWPEAHDQYLANIKKATTGIDMAAFKKAFDNKGNAAIIDIREPDEYKSGHLPGVVFIPRGILETRIWRDAAGYPNNLDMNKKIYLYCRSGHRAMLAAKTLQDLGFTNVTYVNMNISDWIKAGYPVER